MWSTYVFLAASVACANAFGTGAPPEACGKMKPHHHGLKAQKSTPPYTITTSEQVARGGSPIEVVISGKTPQDTIRGVLVQAHANNKIVGTFKVEPNDPFFQLLDCGAPGNAVTHKHHDPADDKQTVTVTWTPPPNFNGEVNFRTTVVHDFDTFWVKIPSSPLKVESS